MPSSPPSGIGRHVHERPDPTGADAVIRASGLTKTYDGVDALRGIDLEVHPGEVLAVLGPNGAGKTTTIEILEGYRDRTAGEVTVLGVDPERADRSWRGRIGVVLQQCRLQGELTVAETLAQYAGYFPDPLGVEQTVALVGLEAKAGERVSKLSGGQQRRLDVGVALVGNPELLFLDEPTTGFDPSARRQAWSVISDLRELGKTIVLTTHYMDEAQALADRVAVIAHGEIVATGTPDTLGGRAEATSVISFRLTGTGAAREAEAGAETATGLPAELGPYELNGAGLVTLRSGDPVAALNRLTGWSLESGVALSGLEVRRPSLEDVYLELIGGGER